MVSGYLDCEEESRKYYDRKDLMVSVIVRSRNEERYIGHCIQSIYRPCWKTTNNNS